MQNLHNNFKHKKKSLFILFALISACCHQQPIQTVQPTQANQSAQAEQPKKRNPAMRKLFLSQNPCPSTGKNYGACPGYVVDHIVAIKRGGGDNPYNMQWQTEEQGKEKDRWE